MINILKKLFGSKSDRDIKEVFPYVEKINQEWQGLKSISDDALRGKTASLKATVATRLKQFDDQIGAIQQELIDRPDISIDQKEALFANRDAIETARNKELEVVLLEILPQAFAVVKETARRWSENGSLDVEASELDRTYAATHKHVELTATRAIWHNTWDAAGVPVTWNMVHFDSQLVGGVVLHMGKIAEMATGEGKTLVATLPAYLNALANRGVHIVTVNDYLAKRDSEWMGPLFEFHGLRCDCIDKYDAHSGQRQEAYAADITYGTNNEFGFDYLRDNMARHPDELVQRRHHYAMVDEVDSVLIDDARTPLIISGPVPKGDIHEFEQLKPRISKVVDEQKKLVANLLNEAKKKIADGNEKEGGLALFRAHRGFPKYKPLIKFLSEQGMRIVMQKTESFYLQENSRMMGEADAPLFFVIDEKHNQVELTEKGVDYITGEGEDPQLFVLPDLSQTLHKIDKDADLSAEEKLQHKEQVIDDYGVKSERIHTLTQLLKAYTLFEKDTEYIVVDNKVKIVDEQTGRVMDGRRYSDGLHQALEAKESVRVEEATQTYATITLQNFFRMYHKLAGMTGTAETEAGEFMEIYKLDVVTIPTNRPITRKDEQDLVYKTTREKFNAVADEIMKLTQAGRPVLVGTTSVEISELLSRMLKLRNIKHQVLNAKLHQKEADIVAEAGKPSTVTIATNMAGRGTDIKLTPESKAAGGLAIIGTERHESRRVDRQLRGRSGRQGDPGSSQFFVSLEDNLMRLFASDRVAKLMDRMGFKEGEVIQHSWISKSIENAQKKVEENNFSIRKRLLEYDNVMNAQREVIYKRRHNALFGDRLELDILNMIYDLCEDAAASAKGDKGFELFNIRVIRLFGFNPNIDLTQFNAYKPADLSAKLYHQAIDQLELRMQKLMAQTQPIFRDLLVTKGETIDQVVIPFTDGKKQINVVGNLQRLVQVEKKELQQALQKFISLAVIDTHWKEHLRDMDDLKQSVQNAVFEQKDPLLIYKFEAFELFKGLLHKVNEEIVSFLYDAEIPVQAPSDVREARESKPQRQQYKENKQEAGSLLNGNGGGAAMQSETEEEPIKLQPIRSQKVANRNDRVSVQYMDGTIKRDVKYKTIEQDIETNKCVLID
jgi:preprotein translocase subunit SecA